MQGHMAAEHPQIHFQRSIPVNFTVRRAGFDGGGLGGTPRCSFRALTAAHSPHVTPRCSSDVVAPRGWASVLELVLGLVLELVLEL